MARLFIPDGYRPLLNEKETENAIVLIKNFFQLALSTQLGLTRVTAPLFVRSGLGLNDDLNGVERPVSFPVKALGDARLEIVHSLAKWKRLKVTDMGLREGFGIYTDMNAIRADEELDNLHSLYVDQWDWELRIAPVDRTVMCLKAVVEKVYRCIKQTEFYVYDRYDAIKPELPEHITFLHSEDLLDEFPGKDAKGREYEACKKYGAVFIIGIGGKLPDGTIHDGRAPDYDDWTTETGDGHRGLNGDLLVWNPVLQNAMELSSMGIRVDPAALAAQLAERGCFNRTNLPFHSRLLHGELFQTMGGGIGQSRLCMYFLRKAHIGEIQVSTWPVDMVEKCAAAGILIL